MDLKEIWCFHGGDRTNYDLLLCDIYSLVAGTTVLEEHAVSIFGLYTGCTFTLNLGEHLHDRIMSAPRSQSKWK